MQGRNQSDTQFQNCFSISKLIPNSNFLFEIYKQAGWLLKSTKFTNFHPILKTRDWFEIWTKNCVCSFDFERWLNKVWLKWSYTDPIWFNDIYQSQMKIFQAILTTFKLDSMLWYFKIPTVELLEWIGSSLTFSKQMTKELAKLLSLT